jgi:hypothetical protein
MTEDSLGWWPEYLATQLRAATTAFPFSPDGFADLRIDLFDAQRKWPQAALIILEAKTQFANNSINPDQTPTEISGHLRRLARTTGTLLEQLKACEHFAVAAISSNKIEKGRAIAKIIEETVVGSFSDCGHAATDWWLNDEMREEARARFITWESDVHSLRLNLLEAAGRIGQIQKNTKSPYFPHHAPMILKAAELWTSLTGRTASAAKVSSKPEPGPISDTRPAFVRFVALLASHAGVPAPTRAQVESALAPIKPASKNLA